MAIKIPTLKELTDSQIEIQDLPINGRYLITGGPGSGKTCIAVRRTELIKKDNPDAKILTILFTNALNDFFGDGIRSLEINSNVVVWAKWQVGLLKHVKLWPYERNAPVPSLEWATLSDKILSLKLKQAYDHLIIDEAQDFSESDLKVMNLIAKNITVFADPDQKLRDRGVENRSTIKSILGIDDEDCYHLAENHRNTKEIIRAASSLAQIHLDVNIDDVQNTGQKPKLFNHVNDEEEIAFINRVLKSNPEKDIGILHLNRSTLKLLYDKIENGNVQLLRVDTFDFNANSPKLCTLNSAKGLEFDIVIMPQMDKESYWVKPINLKRIYVGMTRAKSELIMSYSGSYPTEYLSQIDPNTIERIQP